MQRLAPVYDNQGNIVDNKTCPFCRTPTPTSPEEDMRRLKERVKLDDPIAIHNLGCNYRGGHYGLPQDYTKALELWHRASEFGNALSYNNIGHCYYSGGGVEVDEDKANYYYELAAIGGDSMARHNLGSSERNAGNFDRALKHFMIAVRGGDADSLARIKQLYTSGNATKEHYAKALQTYQAYVGEIKSAQRDAAAAANDRSVLLI